MSKKVLVVNDSGDCGASYYIPFEPWGDRCLDVKILDKNPDDIALVVFTGGEDVSPSLYDETQHPKTYANLRRDNFEKEIFKKANSLALPLVGICRGSQFLCVMAGGKLVQHVTGHGCSHQVRTNDGRVLTVSSTHHQMQLPPMFDDKELNPVPLAWAEPRLSKVYETGEDVRSLNPPLEYDVVWYPNIRALAMQYHPEMMSKESDGWKYCQELVARFHGEPE